MFKKITIFSLLLLDVVLVTNSIFAAPNLPPPAPTPPLLGVDLAGQKGPNPAPPIGLTPCGKTMCNENELCIQYPQDKDLHCVPKALEENFPEVPPQDLPGNIKLCPEGEGVFPPNSTCFNNMTNTVKDIDKYQKTCIYEPVVQYDSERWPDDGELPQQDFEHCGKGYAGPDPNAPQAPSTIDKYKCAVNMLVYTDVRDAELGGYGSTPEVRQNESTDFVAQNYLYNALFDKPLDLSDNSTDNPKNNREAYRTYWRLMSANTQANLRSFTLNMANENQINNIKFKYKNTLNLESESDSKTIYTKLKTQVILFWHWPFIRIGCLVDYPVCPEYAQAISELKPSLQSLSETISKNALTSAVMGPAINIYNSTATTLGHDLQDAYAAFVPLDFDSVRSYIIKKRDEDEKKMYDAWWNVDNLVNVPNSQRYGTKKPLLTNVSRENIPYLGAIHQGLLSPKFGIISSLQPNWMFTEATKSGQYINYKLKNEPQEFPEVKIAKQNLLSFLQEQGSINPLSIATNTLVWLYKQAKDYFQKDTVLKGYTETKQDLIIPEIRTAYVNYQSCPLPVSYHLLSPKTGSQYSPIPPNPDELPKYSDHHQVVSIWGPQVQWIWDPIEYSTEIEVKDKNGKVVYTICKRESYTKEHYPIDDCTAAKRHWKVTGIKHGKALTVLNNPKATDIKNAIVQDNKYSLYKTLLPDAVNKKKITDASIDAPYAANYSAYNNGGGTSTSPNGTQKVLNKVEPINRINNRAQDTMHLLQNCWTVPEELQNSPRCKLALVAAASESANICKNKNIPDSEVDSKFLGTFKSNFIDLADRWTTDCPGPENNLAEECYNLVASEAKKGGVNPAFALTIWLNESGASNYCHGGPTTQDMGINLPALYQKLEEQIKAFINMATMKLCETTPGSYVENMHRWLSRYQSSAGVCNPLDTRATQYYYDVMSTTWDFVTGCTQHGTRGSTRFGIDWPTDMSCP